MREYDVLGPYEKPVRLHVIEAARNAVLIFSGEHLGQRARQRIQSNRLHQVVIEQGALIRR